MCKEIKALVRSSVEDTERFTVKVRLHQGSALSPYLFDLVMDVFAEGVKEGPSSSKMFAAQMTSRCAETREKKLKGIWRRGKEG